MVLIKAGIYPNSFYACLLDHLWILPETPMVMLRFREATPARATIELQIES